MWWSYSWASFMVSIVVNMLVRTCLAVIVLVCCACSQPKEVRRYPLHGEILRLDPQGKIATIKHEKIGDWMGAMTMEFPVKDAQEFSALREGEHVNGTVFVQDLNYWVGEIKEDAAAK